MATPLLTKHVIPGTLGPLLVDVRSSDRSRLRPAVLIVHGFKGFADWGMFPALADRMARAGFSAVSVNLSGSGVDETGSFVFPERFGHNTYSAELQDISRVVDALAAGRFGMPSVERMGIVGHSRGGGMAILAASHEPRIKALVTWAAISHVNRWPGQAEQWRRDGRLDVVNTRTGQVLPLYPDVLSDMEQNGGALDIQAAAGRLSIPWLLIHATGDTAVPVEEARALAGAAPATAPPRTLILDGSGHTFGAVHPFAGMTADLGTVIDETVGWMGKWV